MEGEDLNVVVNPESEMGNEDGLKNSASEMEANEGIETAAESAAAATTGRKAPKYFCEDHPDAVSVPVPASLSPYIDRITHMSGGGTMIHRAPGDHRSLGGRIVPKLGGHDHDQRTKTPWKKQKQQQQQGFGTEVPFPEGIPYYKQLVADAGVEVEVRGCTFVAKLKEEEDVFLS